MESARDADATNALTQLDAEIDSMVARMQTPESGEARQKAIRTQLKRL